MKLNILHITPDFNYACGRSYYVYLLLKYLRLHHNVHLITNGGDSFDRLDELNIPYTIVKRLHSKNPVSFAKNINNLRAFIKEKEINILHTHHRYSELIGLNAGKLIKPHRPKTVFTSLSIVDRRYKVEYKSDKIIAVSGTIKKMLTGKFRVNENKIALIPNFTDTEETMCNITPVKKSLGNSKFFNILAIGRFHPEKNFEILLKALNILKDSSLKLTLIGEGESETGYKKYINHHKLNAEIIPPQKKITKYFGEAGICVLPSAKDPFPNFMLQAGLHKKPFIGTNIDGIAELIKDGTNGLLFPDGDENELAGKIMQFKNNKSLASKCAQNLYSDVMNGFTQKWVIPKIEKLYYDLMKL